MIDRYTEMLDDLGTKYPELAEEADSLIDSLGDLGLEGEDMMEEEGMEDGEIPIELEEELGDEEFPMPRDEEEEEDFY